MNTTELQQEASRFYAVHQGQHLSHDRMRMIDRCAVHLAERFQAAHAAAEDAALKAFADFDTRTERSFIDLEQSTSRIVFVNDPLTGLRRAFTVSDLVALIPPPVMHGDALTAKTRITLIHGH